MASLKDLRNRIASVKATQKITKAMQMVAAAKLRRAQMAAEAARPYAERMGAVLANVAGGVTGEQRPAPARRHRQGRRASARRLHGRARPVRRVQLLDRPPRPRPRQRRCMAQGKTVKILCVGKKGYDVLRRQFATADHRPDRAAQRPHAGLRHRRHDRPARSSALFDAGEFDVATIFFSRFRSVIAQIPTAQQMIPAEIPEAAAPTGAQRVLRIRARGERDPRRRCCRATSRCRCSGRCSRTPRPSRARG